MMRPSIGCPNVNVERSYIKLEEQCTRNSNTKLVTNLYV